MTDRELDALIRRRIEKETMTVNPKIEEALRSAIQNPEIRKHARRVTRRGLALGAAAALLVCAVALALGTPQRDVTTGGMLALSQPGSDVPTPTPMPPVTAVPSATLEPRVTPMPTATPTQDTGLVLMVTPTPMPGVTPVQEPIATLAPRLTAVPEPSLTPVPNTLFVSDISADSEQFAAQYAGLRLSISETLRNNHDRWLYVVWEPMVDTFILDRVNVSATPTKRLIQPGGAFTFGFVDYLTSKPFYTDVWLGTQYHSYEVLAGEDDIVWMATHANPGDEDYEAEQAYFEQAYADGKLIVFGGELILPDSVIGNPIEAYANKGLMSYNPISTVDRKPYVYADVPVFDTNAEPLATYAGNGYTARLMSVGDYANPYIIVDCVYDSGEAMNALLAERLGLFYSTYVYLNAAFSAAEPCGEWQDAQGTWHSTYIDMAVGTNAYHSGDTLHIRPLLYADPDKANQLHLEDEAIVYTLP